MTRVLLLLLVSLPALGAGEEFKGFIDCYLALKGEATLLANVASEEPAVVAIGPVTRGARRGFYAVTEKTAYFVEERKAEKPVWNFAKQVYRLRLPEKAGLLIAQQDDNAVMPAFFGLGGIPDGVKPVDVDLTGKGQDAIDEELHDKLALLLIALADHRAGISRSADEEVFSALEAKMARGRVSLASLRRRREAIRRRLDEKQDPALVKELLGTLDAEDAARESLRTLQEDYEARKLEDPEGYAAFRKAKQARPKQDPALTNAIEVCRAWKEKDRAVNFGKGPKVTLASKLDELEAGPHAAPVPAPRREGSHQ